MALDFPSSPAPGDVHHGPQGVSWSWDGAKWANGLASGPPNGVIVAASPPTPAIDNSLWYDSVGGQLYVRFNDGNGPAQWVAASNIAGLANAASKTDMAASFHNTGRNLLHNSMFNVNQRGTGGWGANSWTSDRWYFAAANDTSTCTINPISDSDRAAIGNEAALNAWGVNIAGSASPGSQTILLQNMEQVSLLAGKTITVSWWCASSAAGIRIGASLVQSFGYSAGASPAVASNGKSVATIGAWARYSITLTAPSIAGKTTGTDGIDSTGIYLWLSAAADNDTLAGGVGVQSGYVNFWGMQLEFGDVATPFELRPYEHELSQCQRFYAITEVYSCHWTGAVDVPVGTTVYFPVQMTRQPSAQFVDFGGINVGTATVGPVSAISAYCFAKTTAAPGQCQIQGKVYLAADL